MTCVPVESLCRFVKSFAQGFFLLFPGFSPRWTNVVVGEFVEAVDEGKGISNGPAEDNHRRRYVAVRIRGIPQLHHGV